MSCVRERANSVQVLQTRHEVLGVNARLDELQAAVLRVKLRHLDDWNAARQRHAATYTQHLQHMVEAVPIAQPWGTHVYYVYVVQVRDRDHFRSVLEQEGIATGVHYPVPVHLQAACACYGYGRGSLPVTEAVAERIVSLPMYPELTTEQLQKVTSTIEKSLVLQVS